MTNDPDISKAPSRLGWRAKVEHAMASSRDGIESGDGFIVITALWILLALATVAAIAAAYVGQSAIALTGMNDESQRTDAVVTASLELTAYRLSLATVTERPTRGAFHVRLGRAEVDVAYLSESARINLNAAPTAMIAGLFAALGAQGDSAGEYAARVVGWRSPRKSGAAANAAANAAADAAANAVNEEDALYRAAGLSYLPRHAPFSDLDELWLVLGLPPALVERAMQFLTIYSELKEVNVLIAPAEVIAALPGVTPARLSAFLDARERLPPDPDPKLIMDALGERPAGASTRGSDFYRVRTRIIFDDGRRKSAEVVIGLSLDDSPQPYRVLSWREDVDLVTGAARGPEASR